MAAVSSWSSEDLNSMQQVLEALSDARANFGIEVTTVRYLSDTLTLEWDESSSQYRIEGVE